MSETAQLDQIPCSPAAQVGEAVTDTNLKGRSTKYVTEERNGNTDVHLIERSEKTDRSDGVKT